MKKNKLVKALIYRFFAIVVSFCVVLVVTGEIQAATEITLWLEVIKLVAYYIYEKAYDHFTK